ncbi:hypothetical protein BGX31_006548 [Mortierella sp. GBA43]|nr:hypothetical protein BGX31_006548 [Mortierella sp. GBA43]
MNPHLEWLSDRFKNGKSVTMPQFVNRFAFTNENDAHQAFSALLSSTRISRVKRKRLDTEYGVWRRNHGKKFWSSMSASTQIKISMDKAAEYLSQGGEHVIKTEVQGFIQDDDFSHTPSDHTTTGRKRPRDSSGEQDETPQKSAVSPSTSPSGTVSTSKTTTRDEDLFILPSQFSSEDAVDKFFFDHPTSAWNHASMSTKKAYKMYTKSLQTVRDNTAVGDEVREHAIKALATWEAAFRSAYFEVENGMQQHAATTRKHDLEDAGEEAPSHLALHFDIKANEALDGEFDPFSTSETALEIDRLVGPGDLSSYVTKEGQRVIDDCNITRTIMKHRRSVIKAPCIANVDDLLLINFVVSRSILLELLSDEIVDQVLPLHRPVALAQEESSLVGQLSTLSTLSSYHELRRWFGQQPMLSSSIVYRMMSLYFLEAGLWSDCNWFKKGTGDNEDTFTDNLIKPLISGAFGDLAGCSFRWSRDELRSGKRMDPDLGTFHLVSGPYQFGLLHSIGPLLSAKPIARSAFDLLKSRRTVPTNQQWTRGSFDYKGVTMPMSTTTPTNQ